MLTFFHSVIDTLGTKSNRRLHVKDSKTISSEQFVELLRVAGGNTSIKLNLVDNRLGHVELNPPMTPREILKQLWKLQDSAKDAVIQASLGTAISEVTSILQSWKDKV